jgi:hypothetical protein
LFPSADEATESHQPTLGTLFEFHVVPEFVEIQMNGPRNEGAATKLTPSADEATLAHAPPAKGTLFEIQVSPEFVEVQTLLDVRIKKLVGLMDKSAAATNRLPSADEATETQTLLGARVCAQVPPVFVEV